jgi:hypothetical protein
MSSDLKLLIEKLGVKEDKAIKLCSGGRELVDDVDLNPTDFLERAEEDYELGGSASLLNSITNAKRAIHCQIDQTLTSLGFNSKRWNLPQKIDMLNRLGFIAPRILKRVTDARNVLEHEYSAPTIQQIEESLDLAALFLGATNRYLENFGDEFSIGNRDEQVDAFCCKNELRFSFGYKEKGFNVVAFSNVSPECELRTDFVVGRVFIKPTDEIFPNVIRLVVASDNDVKIEKALKSFFTTISKQ